VRCAFVDNMVQNIDYQDDDLEYNLINTEMMSQTQNYISLDLVLLEPKLLK